MSKNTERNHQKKPLNARRQAFVNQYVIDLNATQAAIRAGYSKARAEQTGHDLLREPGVAEAIAEAQRERNSRVQLTQDRVLQEVMRLAFLDIRKALNPDGSLKAITELDDDTAAAISGLDLLEEFAGHGEDRMQIGWTKKLKLADKKGALELLMRHMGMLNDKLKLQGDAANPLVLLIQQMNGSAVKPVANPTDEED